MAKIKMRSTSLSGDPNGTNLKFHFFPYAEGLVLRNNEQDVDFVTDGKSLYVCYIDGYQTHGSIQENGAGLLKIVSQGEPGKEGKPGQDGAAGAVPTIGAQFIDGAGEKKLALTVNGRTAAMTDDLTPPSWKPVVDGNILSWELTDDRYAPDSIDLMKLRPINERPILLRTNSDNTKRSDEVSGPANFIQWKYEGDEYWTNLISISELMNLALAGVSFWEATDGKWHFGHREVVRANYISDKNGRQIISNVRLGDVLFDAGEVPFPDNTLDIELINQRIDALEAGLVKSVSINGGNPNEPDLNGNVDLDLSAYAKKSEIPDTVDAYTKAQSDARYQPKGDYVKGIKVNGGTTKYPDSNTGIVNLDVQTGGGANTSDCVKSVTINGTTKTPVNGNVSFTISVGEPSLFDVRFDTSSHKLQKTVDGQTWTDLVDLDDFGGTVSGVTEADVKHIIGQILEGVLDSAIENEYVKGNDHNYFIRLSDLANYTTVDDVAAMIMDAMTGQNIDYYRVFTLYQRTNSPTTAPAKPVVGVWEWNTAANVDTIALKPNNSSAWSNHPENATTSTPYLWMTSATYSYLTKSEVGQDPWETPICLTAEPGEDGADGDSVEFIYILCTDAEFNNIKNTTPVAEHGDNRPDDLPVYTTPSGNGWTDHPSGISETYQIEAVSIRTKDNGIWSGYSNPTIWSMWGEDGIDGDGVEYIFAVAAENETAVDPQTGKRELNASFFRGQSALDILPLSDQDIEDYEDAGGNYQIPDWCPDGTIKHGVQMRDLNWTDNPSDVGPDQPYEFVAIRKKKLDPISGQMKWGPFSTPALWGFWGQKTVTVIESGSIYRHPYTCFAFTRSTTDITGYTVVNPWTQTNPAQTYAEWIAADNTRETGYYENPLAYIVTLDENNQPVSTANLTWSDTIPAPPGQLYMITNHIGDEASGTDQGWTSPRAWGDASGFQVEYAVSSTATDNVYNRVTGYTLPKLDDYDLDNYPNLNDPDNDGIDEVAWRTAVQNAGKGVWGDEDQISDPDYMATCYKKQEGVWSAWQISRIKGEKGDDSNIPGPAGKDGTDIEFVYFRTDSESHRPGMSETYGTYDGQTKVSEDLYEDDFFPMATANGFTLADNELKIGNDFFWHDHPAGVTENLSCEWVGMRHSSYDLQGDKVWGNFNIALWSKYGANGRDGDGIEYVFWGLSEQDYQQLNSTWPTQQASNARNNGENVQDPNDPRLDEPTHRSITDSEYLPAILINNTERQAVDDNPGIENNKYVFASMRKYTYDSVSGTSKWGEFSEIKLWNEQPASAQESIILDIEDDTHPVYVDENGRILDRYMDYTGYSTDGMYLYKNLLLLNCGNVSIKGENGDVTIATLNNGGQSNNYDKVTIASPGIPVTSNGITAHVYPYWAWKYEDSNHSTVQLRVVFDKVSDQNPILNDSFDITIKVQSADGQYVGSDILRLVPKYSDKEVELLSVPGTQRTSEEGGTTYSDSEFMFYGWYGDSYTPLSLIADTAYYFKYDDQVSWTKFEIPANNSGLTTLKNSVDGVTEGGRYFYFDRTGTFISDNASNINVNGAFFKIWLYNSDYSDNNHGIWTNWKAIAYVLASAFTATNDYPVDELYFGIGFDGNEPIDEANVHIIYPGKNGESGINGSYKKELYRRGTENAAEGSWVATWSSPGATIATLTTAGWSATKPSTTSSYPHIWMTRADVTIGQEGTQVCVWETPTRITPVDGNVTHTYEHTYEYLAGTIMRTSAWSAGVNDTTKYWDGNTRVITDNGVENASSTDEGIKYLDVVSVTNTSNGVTKTRWFKCILNHKKTSSLVSPVDDDTRWAEFSIMSDAAFHDLLVENAAYIENLTSKQVVITDSNDEVVAGMTSNSNYVGNSDVILWAGEPTTSGAINTAPFTVDKDGKLVSDDATITGTIHAEEGTIDGDLTIGSNGSIISDKETSDGGTTVTTRVNISSGSIKNEVSYDDFVSEATEKVEITNGNIHCNEKYVSQGVTQQRASTLDADNLIFADSSTGRIDTAVVTPLFRSNGQLDVPVNYPILRIEVVSQLTDPDPGVLYFIL